VLDSSPSPTVIFSGKTARRCSLSLLIVASGRPVTRAGARRFLMHGDDEARRKKWPSPSPPPPKPRHFVHNHAAPLTKGLREKGI